MHLFKRVTITNEQKENTRLIQYISSDMKHIKQQWLVQYTADKYVWILTQATANMPM